ncbi:DUF305 domain-containing protein [Nakamurella flava]|uniref:DUF305 domain-containing protein n=1 Tax=Nakamurella flava TaxID=2576308 RepID=A0A4U6QL84_9ACTN|nr:DUF305 domain-containing protein [Nakamurella flava]TKV60878.1 DUF305 domain-containing protein [Nakamurella flava]
MNLPLRPTVPAPGHRTTARTAAVIAATVTLTLVATACSSGGGHGAGHAEGGSATASTAPSASPSSSLTADIDHNDADVAFADGMIVHHRGAVEMAALAADRAGSDAVRGLAARISAAQQPEIDRMTGWLQTWSIPGADPASSSTTATAHDMSGHSMSGDTGTAATASPDSASVEHTAMGMMSAGEMATLTAARGADFDRIFLEMMIVHHEGAVDMSRTQLSAGRNPQALALAQDIIDNQTAEIAEMQGLLAAG